MECMGWGVIKAGGLPRSTPSAFCETGLLIERLVVVVVWWGGRGGIKAP